MSETFDWAREQLATADFGDVRREERAAQILRRAAERPSGRISEVFTIAAEQQAAYNFVEGTVAARALIGAFRDATLRAADSAETIHVVVDGTSLTLTDHAKTKSFGSVGSRRLPTRGLKVVDALGVGRDGVPLGLLDLEFWARGPKPSGSRYVRRRDGDTEVRRWVEVIERTADAVRDAGLRPWFVIDREGDCAAMLRAVSHPNVDFTIRAAQYKRLCLGPSRNRSLIQRMRKLPVVGKHFVEVPASTSRVARIARLDVRFGRATLQLPNGTARGRDPLEVSVVWARERRPPRGQAPLDWMLLTNRPVLCGTDALEIIESYCLRWRIEDFHRTWKSGHCCVEDTQLRDADHVIRWATMLAAVATRVERLKHLARMQPDAPAIVELSELEIEALRAIKRLTKKRTETIGDEMPTIRVAVRWIAQLGGYAGKDDAHPGAITIARGLEQLLVLARGFALGKRSKN
jgi:hypothetical protein